MYMCIYIYEYIYIRIYIYIFKRKINTTFSFKLGSTIDDTSFRRVDGSVQVDGRINPRSPSAEFHFMAQHFSQYVGAALCRSWPTWLMRYIATSNGLVFVYFSTCTHSIGTIHVASGLAHIYMADRCLGRPLPCRMPASSDAMSFTLRICTPHLMSILSICVCIHIYIYIYIYIQSEMKLRQLY